MLYNIDNLGPNPFNLFIFIARFGKSLVIFISEYYKKNVGSIAVKIYRFITYILGLAVSR